MLQGPLASPLETRPIPLLPVPLAPNFTRREVGGAHFVATNKRLKLGTEAPSVLLGPITTNCRHRHGWTGRDGEAGSMGGTPLYIAMGCTWRELRSAFAQSQEVHEPFERQLGADTPGSPLVGGPVDVLWVNSGHALFEGRKDTYSHTRNTNEQRRAAEQMGAGTAHVRGLLHETESSRFGHNSALSHRCNTGQARLMQTKMRALNKSKTQQPSKVTPSQRTPQAKRSPSPPRRGRPLQFELSPRQAWEYSSTPRTCRTYLWRAHRLGETLQAIATQKCLKTALNRPVPKSSFWCGVSALIQSKKKRYNVSSRHWMQLTNFRTKVSGCVCCPLVYSKVIYVVRLNRFIRLFSQSSAHTCIYVVGGNRTAVVYSLLDRHEESDRDEVNDWQVSYVQVSLMLEFTRKGRDGTKFCPKKRTTAQPDSAMHTNQLSEIAA